MIQSRCAAALNRLTWLVVAMALGAWGCPAQVQLGFVLQQTADAGDGDTGDAGFACVIDGQRFESRALDPNDRTQCCNPALNPTGWTPLLSAGPSYPLGLSPNSACVADFNSDGLPDIAIADNVDGGVLVFLSSRDAGFHRSAVLSSAVFPGYLAAADLNHDGFPDILVAGRGGLGILMSDGDGGFLPEVDYLRGLGVLDVAVADFNGDGWPDAIVATSAEDLRIFENLADGGANDGGQLGAPAIVARDFYVNHLRSGYFNADDLVDFAAAGYDVSTPPATPELAIFLGLLDGGFASPVRNTAMTSGTSGPWGLWRVALVPGGSDDLLASTMSEAGLYVVGADLGGLNASTRYPAFGDEGAPLSADLNGDGYPDAIFLTQFSIGVYINQGDGHFWPAVSLPMLSRPLQDGAAADFNGDGAPDLATIGNGGPLTLWLNGCP